VRTLLAKLRHAFRRASLRREMADEVRAHIDLIADEYIARGVPPEEARIRARREFGRELGARERAYDAWRFPAIESFLGDVAYALRGIRRAPAFSGVILLTFAFGIGATTAIFSVVYNVSLRPLPFPDGDRLVWMGESAGTATGISVTWGNYRAWKEQAGGFEAMAAYRRAVDHTLTGIGEPRVVTGSLVSRDFFPLLGWAAAEGRLFGEADDRPGAPPTIVLTDEFRRATLGDDAAPGRLLTLDGEAFEVIGVLPPGHVFLDQGIDFYLPLGTTVSESEPRSRHGAMRVIGRLADGVAPDQAAMALDDVMERLAVADPGPESDHVSYVVPLSDVVRGDAGQSLWLLLGAVGLMLLLACANVASLLLGRSVLRGREMAVRAAIGASRGRLVRQVLTETLTLAALGGLAGILMARLGLSALVAAAPARVPRLNELGLDLPLLLFAVGVTLAAGLLAGVAPVSTDRTDLTRDLKEGSAPAGAGRSSQRLRGFLVAGEIAIAVVLAFASTQLIRSFVAARTGGVGFDPEGLVALELRLPPGRYPDAESRRQFYRTLTERLAGQPWARSVAGAGCPPMWGNCGDWWYSIAGLPAPDPAEIPVAQIDVALPGTFGTLGMGLLAGRDLAGADRQGPPVAVVNETFARRWWSAPKEAVGQRIKIGGPEQEGPTVEIVGVVGDASQEAPDRPADPKYWLPFDADPRGRMVVLIRTPGDVAVAIPSVRSVVAELDPDLPVWSLRAYTDVIGTTLEARRFGTWLLGLFAVLALMLAAVGVYGVLQQWVSARHRDIAIRTVLGAGQGSILAWCGRHALRLIGIGVAAGLVGSLAASRWLRAVVFGVMTLDPVVLAVAAVGVTLLAVAAAGLPLFRATRVDAATHLERG